MNGMWRTMRWMCAGALLSAGGTADALDVGERVPAVSLHGAPERFDLSGFRGKTVYLDFWASWCGPCRKSIPWMNEMQKKYAGRGLVVVGVNLDSNRDDADGFLEKVPANFRIAYDPKGETPRGFGVKGMPTSYLIDGDGRLIAKHQGFNDKAAREMEEKIDGALRGRL